MVLETTVNDNLTVVGTTGFADDITLSATGKKIVFYEAGEYISGDGTDLTIASGGKINLSPGSDVVIPTDKGLKFVGDSNYIEYVASGAQLKIVSGGALNQTAGAASTINTTAGNLTVDSNAATLTLDGHTGVDIDA